MATARTRHRNGGIRKLCACKRSRWPKCPHSWYFNFKLKGGASYRFSIDSEVGEHIEGKTEAEALADSWRTAIRHGKFRRRADGPRRSWISIDGRRDHVRRFAETYLARRGKPATTDQQSSMRRLMAFELDGAAPFGDKLLGAITGDDVELFFAHLQTQRRAASTRNHYVTLVRAMFKWAVRKKYLTPIRLPTRTRFDARKLRNAIAD